MMVLDRWQRRSVLIVSDLIRGAVVLAIAFWLLPLLSGQVENRGLQLVYWMTGVLGSSRLFIWPRDPPCCQTWLRRAILFMPTPFSALPWLSPLWQESPWVD